MSPIRVRELRPYIITLAVLVMGASAAGAALTTEKCIAAKLKVWGKLRQCERNQEAKAALGKPSDVLSCGTKTQEQLVKITSKAAAAALVCRYVDNGDATITDLDTGLRWEKKDSADTVANGANPHDADNTYTWETFFENFGDGFLDRLNGMSADGTTVTTCFSGHCDWRIPTIAELQTIASTPPCLAPCIDPIYGSTRTLYWSSTTSNTNADDGWLLNFSNASVSTDQKPFAWFVRAVRNGF